MSSTNALDAPRDRKARAAKIMAQLDEYIPAPAIPLDHGTPFQLLVAVLLSAQCTDARVNMVTPALFARAPDAATMATMTAAQIMPFIRTCGLAPAKAKALAATSRLLVERHGGDGAVDVGFDRGCRCGGLLGVRDVGKCGAGQKSCGQKQ